MKYLLSVFLLLFSLSSFAQFSANQLTGTWEAYSLSHFDSEDKLDQEATDHFWQMLQGRTLDFSMDGTVDIPGYQECFWTLEGADLSMRYSATAPWYKSLILQLDNQVLKVRSSIEMGDGMNYQILEYHRIED